MMIWCFVTGVTGGQDWANRLKRPTVLYVGRILNHPKQRNSPIQITPHHLKITSYYFIFYTYNIIEFKHITYTSWR